MAAQWAKGHLRVLDELQVMHEILERGEQKKRWIEGARIGMEGSHSRMETTVAEAHYLLY